MNDKDTKVPIYIAIIIALVLVAGAGYFVLGGTKEKEPGGTPTPVGTETPAGTVTPSVTLSPPPKVETIKCETCHDTPSPQKISNLMSKAANFA